MNAQAIGKKNAFVRGGRRVRDTAKSVCGRFTHGSVYTKIAHFIMGFGNLARGQIVKGLLFLAAQALFTVFMILRGGRAVAGFFTLGTRVAHVEIIDGFPVNVAGDNSMLFLLYGVLTFALIAGFIALWSVSVASSYRADCMVHAGKKPSRFSDDVRALLDEKFHVTMLTPAVLGVLVFTALPIVYMVCIAFTDFDSAHPAGVTLFDWIGFAGFKDVFTGVGEVGRMFFPVLLWTLVWAFFATFLNYFAGIIVALLINKKGIRFKWLFRTVFVLTIAVPQFVSLLTMRAMLSYSGPVNKFLLRTGLAQLPVHFFDGKAWVARVAVIAVNLWVGIPYTMLITSGILLNIPAELYEAARMDGAGVVKTFFKITMPYILFVTSPYLITQFIGNINNFNVIYLLSGGMPNTPKGTVAGETDLLVTWLFKLTIENSDFNKGAVVGILTFIVCAVLSLVTYRNTASYKKEDTFQ